MEICANEWILIWDPLIPVYWRKTICNYSIALLSSQWNHEEMVWIIFKNRNTFWIGQGRYFFLLYLFIRLLLQFLHLFMWAIGLFLCGFIKWGAYSCSISWSSGAAVQFPEKLLGLREKRNCRETNLIFCQLQNRVSNWQAIFWAILWENGGRYEKSVTWVFFRMDPFS